MKKIFMVLSLLTIGLLIVACTPTNTKVLFTLEVQDGGEVTGATSGEYSVGTEFDLVATPDEGYSFDGWYEGSTLVEADEAYSFTLEEALTLEARFELIPVVDTFTLTVTATTGGTVSGTANGTYNEDTAITLTANPNEGFEFDGWYVGETLASDDLTYTFNLTANTILEARFDAIPLPVLSAPTGITYHAETQTLTWTEVAGASGYRVSAVETGKTNVTIAAMVVNDESFDLTGLTTANHTVSIVALGVEDESQDSLAATFNLVLVAEKLDSVSGLVYDEENDQLTWDEVANSDGYLVEVYNDLDELVLSSDGDIATSLSLSQLGAGNYSVSVVTYAAVGSVYFNDSDEATLDFEIESLGTLADPQNVRIEDGYLMWDETDARNISIKLYELDSSEEIAEYNVSFFTANQLFLTDLGVADGNYTVGVKFISNRHTNELSAEVTYDITLETVVIYDAAAISAFSGETITGGEHAAASLVEVGGTSFARVVPTADGWGRVASPTFSVNFSKNPVVFLKIGTVIGGYHMQLSTGGSYYSVLGDTAAQGSRNINLTKGNEATLIGVNDAFLRLGVNQMSGVGTSDVSVDYQYVVVSYVNEYSEIGDITELDNVTDVHLNFLGYVTWAPVEFADGYYVTLTKEGEETPVLDGVSRIAPQLEVRQLPEGIYTISVVAYNLTLEIESLAPSADYKIVVTDVITYDAAAIAAFQGDNIAAGLDPENSNLAIINSGKATIYGWAFPATGVNLNMDKNPFIITHVNKVSGGYFYFGVFDGQAQYPYRGDTPGDILNPTVWVYRANVNVDRQTVNTKDFSGPVENFKVRPGVWHAGGEAFSQVWLESIRIAYVEEWQDIVIPVEVLPAPTPEGFGINNGNMAWSSVSVPAGAPDPQYQITITNQANELDQIVINSQPGTSVNLTNLELTHNATYTFAVKVLGDGTGLEGADAWYADSLVGSVQFTYTEILMVNDFTNFLNVTNHHGDFTPNTSLGTNNSLIVEGQADGWNINSFDPILASSLGGSIVEGQTVFMMQLGEVVGAPTMHFGYYRVGSGEDYQRLWGDTTLSTNQRFVISGWVYPGMIHTPVEGDPFLQFYFGFGGGVAGRSFEIQQIVIAKYAIVS